MTSKRPKENYDIESESESHSRVVVNSKVLVKASLSSASLLSLKNDPEARTALKPCNISKFMVSVNKEVGGGGN